MTDDPRSVLVASLGGLGDFVTRWPLWQSLRRSFPRARVSFLGRPSHACLLIAAGLCDGALDFEEPRWGAPGAGVPAFDTAVSVLGSRGAEWAARLGAAAGASRLLSFEPFPAKGARTPVGTHLEAQIADAGLAEPGPSRCPLPDSAKGWAAGWRASRGLAGAETVAIHPGSGAAAKNWPRGRYDELAAALAASGTPVILFEGDAEPPPPGGEAGTRHVTRASGLGLVQAAALLSGCARYFGNDSGFSHLAALMGVPSTVVFGPTDPAVWAPRGERVRVVTARAPCAPCGREGMRECRDRKCLTAITAAQVLSVTA